MIQHPLISCDKLCSHGNLSMEKLVIFFWKENNVLSRKTKLIDMWHRKQWFNSMVINNVFKDLLQISLKLLTVVPGLCVLKEPC